ncbi:MAG: radical SAM domain-containing protein, partial [Thermodesulfobacteriota bacterium]
MQIKELPDVTVILDKQGAERYQKVSYPIRYGRFSEVLTFDYLLQYDLNREIKFIQGRNRNWPHPAEWLKRTIGNDWVYYFSGGYTSLFDSLGEYY